MYDGRQQNIPGSHEQYISDSWAFINIFSSHRYIYRRELQELLEDLGTFVMFWERKNNTTFRLCRESNGGERLSSDLSLIPSYHDRKIEYMRFLSL